MPKKYNGGIIGLDNYRGSPRNSKSGVFDLNAQYTASLISPGTWADPVFSVTATLSNVDEGSSAIFSVTGLNIVNGTYYWTVATNSGDFTVASGSFTVTNNSGQFSASPTLDNTTEGPETFTVSIRTGSGGGPIVATSNSVTINDTSLDPVYTIIDRTVTAFNTTTTTNVASTGSQSGSGPSGLLKYVVGNTQNIFYRYELAAAEYKVRIAQAQGSGGNGTPYSRGGAVYYWTATMDLTNFPGGAYVYIRPGQRGWHISRNLSDGASGGSGGMGAILISPISGSLAGGTLQMNDGISPALAFVVTGSGGGNDGNYQNVATTGPEYSTISGTSSIASAAYTTANGGSYIRGTSNGIGGFPGGRSTDDATISPSITTQYYNNYVFKDVVRTSYAQSVLTTSIPALGYIRIYNI